jgi:hypothetical protein
MWVLPRPRVPMVLGSLAAGNGAPIKRWRRSGPGTDLQLLRGKARIQTSLLRQVRSSDPAREPRRARAVGSRSVGDLAAAQGIGGAPGHAQGRPVRRPNQRDTCGAGQGTRRRRTGARRCERWEPRARGSEAFLPRPCLASAGTPGAGRSITPASPGRAEARRETGAGSRSSR